MAKKRKAKEQSSHEKLDSTDAQQEPVPTADDSGWSTRTKWILSVLAVIHLFAVFSAPWAMPEPSSQLARDVSSWTSPYTNALYMRHGYRFFAPDPGPSHLIIYEVTLPDGETVKGRFPDSKVHRPRLMYHRFFMISEHFWSLGISQSLSNKQQVEELERASNYLRENGLADQANWILGNLPPSNDGTLSDEDIELIVADLRDRGQPHAARTARRRLEAQQTGIKLAKTHRKAWLGGIATYLKKKHGGDAVRIWIQEHLIPEFDQILDGAKLDDDDSYGPLHLVYSEGDEVIE